MPVPDAGAPQTVSVPASGTRSASFSAADTQCPDEPCTYDYTLDCPDLEISGEQLPQGDSVTLTVGPSATATIDTTGVTGIASAVCTLTLAATDYSQRSETAETTLTLK